MEHTLNILRTDSDRPTVADLVAKSVALRAELVEAGTRVDAENSDTAEGLARVFEEGLTALSVPVEFGGFSDGTPTFAAEAFLEIVTNLAASDGALGQNFLTTQLVLRELFDAPDHLPRATLEAIANGVLNENLRLVASNSETGSPRPVSAVAVPGGLRVSGTKTFNSNSGGGGIAMVGFRQEGAAGLVRALIPLDAEGVKQHGDWDNMGQRGTQSQKITYDNVFVPDGWHYVAPIDPRMIPLAFILHGSLVLGSGFGALDAGIAQVRAANRVQISRFATSSEDPSLMRRIGVMSARLHAALGYQRQVCAALEKLASPSDIKEMMVEAFRLKTVCVEAGLDAANGLFDLTGARTTANKFRFDRYWRNARTFACHDPVDVLYNWIGGWDLERKDPDLFVQYKL